VGTDSASTKRIALVASILGSGIVFLDGTIVNVALPAIRAALHGALSDQQWVVEAYLLTLSSLILIGGSLGDLFGRRRVFSMGLVGFGACSALCAIAPNNAVLIGARALQGVAGAMLVPSTLALIMDNFQEHERAAAIGSWTAWTGIVTVIGPLAGGVLVQVASWRWIFAINLLPVAATLMLLRRLPVDSRTPGHVDVVGAILCALGLGGPVFALIEQPQYGWGSARVAVPLIAGIVLLVAFIIWERFDPEPMMPLSLFKVRNFAVGNLTTFTLYAGLGVATFFIVLFIQQVGGYTPVQAGLSLLPLTILMFLLSRRFGALADRIGPHVFMSAGPVLAGVGLLLLLRVNANANYLTQLLPGILVFGLGLSMTVAPLTATVLGSVEPGHSGLASGVNNAVARVAGLIAIAALGAVVAGTFQSRLDSRLAHQPLSSPARTAVASLRNKPLVVNASSVPAPERRVVHTALVNASVYAFRVGIGISGTLAILGGVVSLVGIQNPRRRVPCVDCPVGALGINPEAASTPAAARGGAAAPVPAGSSS
jgi:EmrB/QacA subfamily drug resistance transporter